MRPGEAPPVFRKSFAQHNRLCWIAAALSLLGAALGWIFYAALYSGAALLIEVIRTDDTGVQALPTWNFPVEAGIAAFLMVWTMFDRWRNRFRRASDRAIVGWHVVPEVLLLPPRMTFAVWDHLTLRIKFNAWECDEAWRLLERISGTRVNRAALGQEFPDAKLLARLLRALQLAGWIDLHRGQDDWFYSLRSDADENLRMGR